MRLNGTTGSRALLHVTAAECPATFLLHPAPDKLCGFFAGGFAMRLIYRATIVLLLLVSSIAIAQDAQPAGAGPVPKVNPQLFGGMRWRLIGPFRGGRVLAVEGITGDPL